MDNRGVFSKKLHEVLPFAQMFIVYIHEALRRIVQFEVSPLIGPSFTKREKECLLWAADGKTSWEIAIIIGVSESTIVHDLQSTVKKMNATNRQHAIARAIATGLIIPQI